MTKTEDPAATAEQPAAETAEQPTTEQTAAQKTTAEQPAATTTTTEQTTTTTQTDATVPAAPAVMTMDERRKSAVAFNDRKMAMSSADLIGSDVYGPDNSSVGEIDDIVVSSDNTPAYAYSEASCTAGRFPSLMGGCFTGHRDAWLTGLHVPARRDIGR